ncbi:fatty acid desaturase [Hoyosella rhizosphaerae]|uniref:Phenylacetic acid degradation protein n=1 Tax=Hoyosella rhizosphaerae TaxID=1755582 RepID=A0A916TZB0_9ACTN|nr:fatty acid desaturase [Hoyosella rhizosphaerae]MBN4927122.1 fatty acid desaturase [Hoyosella rhizosphaerae]GGC53801.1 phenylacetic acid degradation protein [Hoyosella rhizosphaerae]
MTTQPVLSEQESQAVRRGVPDPGIPLPAIAIPTVLLWTACMGLWIFTTWLLLGANVSALIAIPLYTVVNFTMFTVAHDATHHGVSRYTWVNELFGRLSTPFVALYASFPLLRFIHIEHHRNTNDVMTKDPDAWTSHGPWWQLPVRWATIDVWYVIFYLRHGFHWGAITDKSQRPFLRRPRAEVVETLVMLSLTVVLYGGLIWAGFGWYLLVMYVIPQRIALTALAWWFDWLPHHGLTATHKEDRYRATRVRVGMEWLLTPTLLYQNYHLVHHLHPAIPFYRYITAWKKNEEQYLDANVAIMNAWGKELTASEYRAWRKITETAAGDNAGDRHQFQNLKVSEVRPLTDDSVSITFNVPQNLKEEFRFSPGQHLTLEVPIDGKTHRRTYSLCASATSDLVRIAVKRIPDGVVSHYLNSQLKAGDTLRVLPPSGRFILNHTTSKARYVGVAAGSGITPVISMLATVLTIDEDAHFTLLYGNKSRESTMFADELSMLARQFEGRLTITHFLTSGEKPEFPSQHEKAVMRRILPTDLTEFGSVTGWYLCGPQELIDSTTDALEEAGVHHDNIHLELFFAKAEPHAEVHGVVSSVTATIDGELFNGVSSGAETVLETVLQTGGDAPYACMGGACGTCRAKLVSGDVEMDISYALTEEEVNAGYILTCQARPVTHQLDVDYDQ